MEIIKNVYKLNAVKKTERDSLFLSCVNINGIVYSFTIFKGIPIMIDMNTWKINLIEDLKGYDRTFLVEKMINMKDNIFALESNGKRIMKYNVLERSCQYFNINCNKKEWGNFAGCAKYGNYLYVFPSYENKILKINSESGEIQMISNEKSNINCHKKDMNLGKQLEDFSYGCQKENLMWLFQRQGNIIGAYDMKCNTYQEYKIPIIINDCVHAIWYKDLLYMLSSEGKIYCWNKTNTSIEIIADCTSGEKKSNIFSRIAITDKNIVLLPSLGDDIFNIDLETKEIKKYLSYPIGFRYYETEGWSKFYDFFEDDSYYYFAMHSMNFILALNKQSGTEHWIKPICPSYRKYQEIYTKYNTNLLFESESSIDDMLVYLNNNSITYRKKNNIFLGYQIWAKMKKEIEKTYN